MLLLFLFLLAGCHPCSHVLEPDIVYIPQERTIQRLPTCFEPLSRAERNDEWGKEILIGDTFAKELDLYRAITSYKRALVLVPPKFQERKMEVQFNIIFCYYLANKYEEAIKTFEESGLSSVPHTFPGFRNLLIILYDSYQKLGLCEKSEAILKLLEKIDFETAQDLMLSTAMLSGDLPRVEELIEENPKKCELRQEMDCYYCEAKSVSKAQFLNAVLPGAGYLYVEQPKTAVTALFLNAIFIAATYEFAHRGYIAPAIITGSLEAGWYLGGINGGGLAAKAYNESIYSKRMKETMLRHRLFPVLQFKCAF